MVDSLIFKNYVFKLQNVQMWIVTELQRGLFADCQEWYFQAAKRTDKGSTILQEVRFADAQEKHFQGQTLNMGSVIQQ